MQMSTQKETRNSAQTPHLPQELGQATAAKAPECWELPGWEGRFRDFLARRTGEVPLPGRQTDRDVENPGENPSGEKS